MKILLFNPNLTKMIYFNILQKNNKIIIIKIFKLILKKKDLKSNTRKMIQILIKILKCYKNNSRIIKKKQIIRKKSIKNNLKKNNLYR